MYETIAKYLTHHASFELSMCVKSRIEFDVFHDAQTGRDTNPNQVIRTAIRSYILKHPEEYNPVFQDMFSEDEIRNMSMGLMEVA